MLYDAGTLTSGRVAGSTGASQERAMTGTVAANGREEGGRHAQLPQIDSLKAPDRPWRGHAHAALPLAELPFVVVVALSCATASS